MLAYSWFKNWGSTIMYQLFVCVSWVSISAIWLVGWRYQGQIDHTLRERKQLWHNDPAMIYVVCQPLSTFCTMLLFLIAQTKPIKLRVERTEGKYFKLKCWALSNLLFCFQTDRGSTIFLVSFVSRSGQLGVNFWNLSCAMTLRHVPQIDHTRSVTPMWSPGYRRYRKYPVFVVKVDSIVLLFRP